MAVKTNPTTIYIIADIPLITMSIKNAGQTYYFPTVIKNPEGLLNSAAILPSYPEIAGGEAVTTFFLWCLICYD